MHQRTEIRKYIKALIIANIDIDETKVFVDRPDPAYLEEAPCILIYFGNETATIESGDKYCVHEYEKTLTVFIDILSLESEDHLDYLGYSVELILQDDWFLGKDLVGYSENNKIGLSRGISLVSVDPYKVVSESQNTVYGQRITYSVPYIQETYSEKKWPTWNEYKFEILRTDGVETDKTLSAGEGET